MLLLQKASSQNLRNEGAEYDVYSPEKHISPGSCVSILIVLEDMIVEVEVIEAVSVDIVW